MAIGALGVVDPKQCQVTERLDADQQTEGSPSRTDEAWREHSVDSPDDDERCERQARGGDERGLNQDIRNCGVNHGFRYVDFWCVFVFWCVAKFDAEWRRVLSLRAARRVARDS